MSLNEKAFYELDKSFKSKVQLSNRHVVNVNGIDNLAINTRKCMQFIKEVLNILDLKTNLLGIGQMMERDYLLIFKGHMHYI